MSYYWVKEATYTIASPALILIRGKLKDFEISTFGEEELIYIKKTIIGIENKDLLTDLKNGEICIGLKHKDEIAAYMFIKCRPFTFRRRDFKLKPVDSYLHNMYTLEAFRGKNLAHYLRYYSYKLLEKKGVTNFYSISDYFNKSTIKFKKKLTSKPLYLYLSVVLL